MGSKQILRFKTRTWFYDRRTRAKAVSFAGADLSRVAVSEGMAQTWVNPGDEVDAEHVVYGETDSYEGYVANGCADLVTVSTTKQSPIASAPDAAPSKED